MELKYRGIAYQTSASYVDAIATEEFATFLGARCSRKHYRMAQHLEQPERLSYRGISYVR